MLIGNVIVVAQMNLPLAKKTTDRVERSGKKSISNVNTMVVSETLVSNQINIRFQRDIVALIFSKFTPTEFFSNSGDMRTNLE